MSGVTIIIITFLAVLVIGLTIVILKSIFMPSKADAIPRLLRMGKTANAIKIAKHIISKNSKDFEAHYYLGKAYVKDNKKELGLMEYKVVNDNALFGEGIDEVTFRKEYGQLLLDFHQNVEAIKNYILLTKQDPKNADNFYKLGTLYKDANRNDLALDCMKKTILLDKKHAKAHAELGLLYYRIKQYAEAKNEIDTAIKLSPDTYTSYYYLGKIQKESKELAAAIKSFEKAQRDPELKLKAIIEHGSCYMMANRLDNAAVDFQRAIELDKQNTNSETLYARYFLASCYEKNRKLDAAIEQWEAIYSRNKNFKDVPLKLSEYKDLNANDFLKDYLTCSNEKFSDICKKAAESGMKMQIISNEPKKWGCEITAVDKKDDSWMNVKKLVSLLRFYRQSDPLEENTIVETIDTLRKKNTVKAYIFSPSGFSLSAKRYIENRPVELIDKQKLEQILSSAGEK